MLLSAKVKPTSIPTDAYIGPETSRIFENRYMMVISLSALGTGHLVVQVKYLALISVRVAVDLRATM